MYVEAEPGTELLLVFADQAFVMVADPKTGMPTYQMNVQRGVYKEACRDPLRGNVPDRTTLRIGFPTEEGELVFNVDSARLLMWAVAPTIKQSSLKLD